jgi:hypothetical protein
VSMRSTQVLNVAVDLAVTDLAGLLCTGWSGDRPASCHVEQLSAIPRNRNSPYATRVQLC